MFNTAGHSANRLTYPVRICQQIGIYLSWSALLITGLSLAVVLSSYVFSLFQPVRWPTLTYFNLALLIGVVSRKWSIFFVIFSLPLATAFHEQIQHFYKPAVPYFVAYPSIDIIAGFTVGGFLREIFQYRKFSISKLAPPWPLGLLLIILVCSTAVAISRNFWQSASSFNWQELILSLLHFKLLSKSNDFAPVADMIVYSFAGLVVIIISEALRNNRDRDAIVFKPVVVAVIVSASYGIFQAFSKIGLPAATIAYRPESIGYGAVGFQSDIHSFAAHMLLGAVGLIGFLVRADHKYWRYITISAIVLSWIAIVLSKSRASLFLACITIFIIFIYRLKEKRENLYKNGIYFLVLIASVLIIIFYSGHYLWIKELYSAITNPDLNGFEAFNELSRWRLEFHSAAIRMSSQYPWFGVGNGEFFRLSSVLEFSNSLAMVRAGGENAHNYFLQTLAEVGIVGILSFMIVFLWPFFNVKKRVVLIPVTYGIFSLFLGNLYSHSFLLRENLILLSVFVGLLYSYAWKQKRSMFFYSQTIERQYLIIIFFGIAFILTLLGVVNEVIHSFGKLPFIYGSYK
ncbi:O-antigen ligase family protein [Zwartia panacis]|uniref:O-antigen ligase family protein n=1 Tax=Zwartia panacis TaxID=2683345 RepID=UPI0025B607F5|nr:O-antigen ligase family protein [Zwartia panacis]MDN4018027.1 O-antigen ligase family protein [Zwartia panacis]